MGWVMRCTFFGNEDLVYVYVYVWMGFWSGFVFGFGLLLACLVEFGNYALTVDKSEIRC